jgi:glutamine synthetase adenylyltransferase
MALTRAQVIWASAPAFGEQVDDAVEAALRRPQEGAPLRTDVADMRGLLETEKPLKTCGT